MKQKSLTEAVHAFIAKYPSYKITKRVQLNSSIKLVPHIKQVESVPWVFNIGNHYFVNLRTSSCSCGKQKCEHYIAAHLWVRAMQIEGEKFDWLDVVKYFRSKD